MFRNTYIPHKFEDMGRNGARNFKIKYSKNFHKGLQVRSTQKSVLKKTVEKMSSGHGLFGNNEKSFNKGPFMVN